MSPGDRVTYHGWHGTFVRSDQFQGDHDGEVIAVVVIVLDDEPDTDLYVPAAAVRPQ
ncbi:MAG: hypothetical protein S0880_10350 [Actinomycetota bacterium]|nr:hypothetical protein [Actinomycetota bacterium]